MNDHRRVPEPLEYRPGHLIVLGTLASTLAGLAYGSVYAVRRNVPIAFPALSTSFKTTAAGLTFFSFRQYLIDPFLSHTLQLPPSDRNPHLAGLLPTSITAILLGGSINGLLRGTRTILPSSFTAVLFCGSFQILLNEVSLLRNELLGISNSLPQTTLPQKAKNDEISPPLRAWERWIPLQRIPDEIWRQNLIEKLESIDARRESVSAEIARLEAALNASKSSAKLNTESRDRKKLSTEADEQHL